MFISTTFSSLDKSSLSSSLEGSSLLALTFLFSGSRKGSGQFTVFWVFWAILFRCSAMKKDHQSWLLWSNFNLNFPRSCSSLERFSFSKVGGTASTFPGGMPVMTLIPSSGSHFSHEDGFTLVIFNNFKLVLVDVPFHVLDVVTNPPFYIEYGDNLCDLDFWWVALFEFIDQLFQCPRILFWQSSGETREELIDVLMRVANEEETVWSGKWTSKNDVWRDVLFFRLCENYWMHFHVVDICASLVSWFSSWFSCRQLS